MKNTNAALTKKLTQYAALVAPILTMTSSAEAQLSYTDIEPDKTLSAISNGATFDLDLNNDGHVDFRFLALSTDSARVLGLMMFPYTTGNLNAIAGDYGMVGNTIVGYPYALAPDQLINDDLKFLDFNFLADSSNHFVFPAMVSTFLNDSFGNWKGGKTDHFLGLKFSDGVNMHFGWARCNVDSANNTITIKDYAYDSLPNTPIIAGDGIQLGTGDTPDLLPFSIFSYEGVVNIFVMDGNLDDITVTVTNMTGESIVKSEIRNHNTRIDLNPFAKGIYLVTLHRGEEMFTRKVSIR